MKGIFREQLTGLTYRTVPGELLVDILTDKVKDVQPQGRMRHKLRVADDVLQIALDYHLKRRIKLGWKPETREKHRKNLLKMFLFFLIRPKYALLDPISIFMKIQSSFRPISIVPQIA
ncbi:hypothetical protein [Zobellia uliginosa]|uniref:hypothetical protein n=1 Tax=Zobellia uliginosa TaxID=143224 RepID=UPI0011156228|nr:hypothetical protein [Zobellia uliginosa]